MSSRPKFRRLWVTLGGSEKDDGTTLGLLWNRKPKAVGETWYPERQPRGTHVVGTIDLRSVKLLTGRELDDGSVVRIFVSDATPWKDVG